MSKFKVKHFTQEESDRVAKSRVDDALRLLELYTNLSPSSIKAIGRSVEGEGRLLFELYTCEDCDHFPCDDHTNPTWNPRDIECERFRLWKEPDKQPTGGES